MATEYLAQRPHLNMETIESLVQSGQTVISAENSAIVDLAMKAIEEGRTATFYLRPVLYAEIRDRYWRLGRGNPENLKPISKEEAARIKADLNIEVDGYANSVNCPRCESVYSTYEFIQQGFEEHGEEMVKSVFSLKKVAVLQINPKQNAICRVCHLDLAVQYFHQNNPRAVAVGGGLVSAGRGGYNYQYSTRDGGAYGCCL